MPADVLAIDLPWGTKRGRTAIASRSREGIAVAAVADDDELVQHVRDRAAPRALILLDVPVDGCNLARRSVDRRLAAIGIPILPSVKAANRGPVLRQRLLEGRPDLRITEIYPYAVLRTLWAHRASGVPFAFEVDAGGVDLSAAWSTWPPRYKREPALQERRRAVRRVASVIAAVPGFGAAVRVVERATRVQLDRVCDEYDALLGLVAGVAAIDRSSWAWTATARAGEGSILSIADGWLRRRFAASPIS